MGGDPEYDADPRHAQLILRNLILSESKKVGSPIVKRDLHNDGELPSAQVTTYRSLTMRGAYLAQDGYDVQHVTKELVENINL